MQVSGTYTFNASQETVWDTLMDPNAIANAMPGVDKMTKMEGEPDTWYADAKINMGVVNGTYSGTVHLSEQSSPDQYRLTVNGEGQASIISGTALISLKYDESTQQTLLTWDADASISGLLARCGQRVIKSAARVMSKQFFRALAKQISTS